MGWRPGSGCVYAHTPYLGAVGLYRLLVDRNESGMSAVVFVVSSQLSLISPKGES